MEFIETPIFTRLMYEYLSENEFRQLQSALMIRPDLGRVIQGSGGIRKLRWALPGEGKRGGLRIIYYWFVSDQEIYLPDLYTKHKETDLSPDQVKKLKALVELEVNQGERHGRKNV